MKLVINLMFGMRPEPNLSSLHDHNISIDSPGVYLSEAGALKVDSSIEE